MQGYIQMIHPHLEGSAISEHRFDAQIVLFLSLRALWFIVVHRIRKE
jgi:hypothetical protein